MRKATKWFDTNELLRMVLAGNERGFNSQLDYQLIKDSADPDGKHVVYLALPHSHIRGERVEDHIRVCFLFKEKGQDEDEPTRLTMDVSWNDYDLMPVVIRESEQV